MMMTDEQLAEVEADVAGDLEREIEFVDIKTSHLAEIITRLRAAEKDAERYRWLFESDGNKEWTEAVEYAINDDGRKTVIDTAIDKAIKDKKQ